MLNTIANTRIQTRFAINLIVIYGFLTYLFRLLYTKKKYIFIFAIIMHSSLVSAQYNASNKIHFYEDTLAMKTEILKHIPIGTRVGNVTDVLNKNKLNYEIKKDAGFTTGHKRKEHIDYLYCDRSSTGNGLVRKRWQFALVFKDDKITDVLVSFGLIGL